MPAPPRPKLRRFGFAALIAFVIATTLSAGPLRTCSMTTAETSVSERSNRPPSRWHGSPWPPSSWTRSVRRSAIHRSFSPDGS